VARLTRPSAQSSALRRAPVSRAAIADPSAVSADVVQTDALAEYVKKHGGSRVIRKVKRARLVFGAPTRPSLPRPRAHCSARRAWRRCTYPLARV